MGCDIHCYIEHREKGRDRWDGFGGRINPGRDYELFGRMAGVRTGAQPVVPLRGLPNDLAWDAEADSSLYISTEEYDGACTAERAKYYVEKCGCSYINDAEGKPWRVTHPDRHSHSWLTSDEFAEALSRCEYGNGVEYLAVLAAMREMERLGHEVRLVFWFDN